jgi:methylenetetrahydrofolate dehydrogenase (NADP+) / methenyltetrahydrofolate cyclohydrolase
MKIIEGEPIARDILARLKSLPKPEKFFGAVLVGNDPASESFLKKKEGIARELGIEFRLYKLSADLNNDELRAEVRKLSEAKTCGGFIVQLPLPKSINRHYVLNVVPRSKDVDVLGERALGAFYTGRNPIVPPVVGVVETILDVIDCDLISMNIAVVGSGLLIGKPISNWLMGKAREVYLLRSGSDLGILKKADLVVTGTGKAGLIKPEMLRDGAGVIDFGYGIDESQTVEEKTVIRGDFDDSSLKSSAEGGSASGGKNQNLAHGFYTPTPGGTGPILVAKLFENFYKLNSEK